MAVRPRSAALLVAAIAVNVCGVLTLRNAAADPGPSAGPTTTTSTTAATTTTAVPTAVVAASAAAVVGTEVTAPPPPVPAPEPAPAPAPEPAPAPAPPAPTAVAAAAPTPEAAEDPLERIHAAYREAVPAVWQDDFDVELQLIEGSASYATGPQLIRIGRDHAEASWPMLLSVVAHEFGHLVAFRYGTWEYVGAAPAGWPDPGYSDPAESWADCVAQAFTGVVDPSYDLPPCPQSVVDWTAAWLASGPPS